MLLLHPLPVKSQELFPSNTGQARAPEAIDIAAERFSAMFHCSERIWPQFRWDEIQVAFISPQSGRALLWNHQTGTPKSPAPLVVGLPAAQFGPVPPGHFMFAIRAGAKTILVWHRTAQTAADLIKVAIHETFHQVAQREMPGCRRGDYYPEDGEARYVRFELLRSLTEALQNRDDLALQRAAYWRQLLLAEHPRDVDLTSCLDLREGTAEFVSMIGTSLTERGCKVTDERLVAETTRRLRITPDLADKLNKDDDSYRLGLVACLLLEQRGVKGWRAKASSFGNLMLQLFSDITPLSHVDVDSSLAQRIGERYLKRNAELKPVVETLMRRRQSDGFWVIAVPERFMYGAYRANGFIRTDLAGLNDIIRGFTAVYRSSSGYLEIKSQDVVSARVLIGEGIDLKYFFVERTAVQQEKGGLYAIRYEGVNGRSLRLRPEEVVGFASTWLIVE
ncbi:MAG: hypothetical protein AAB225_01155 [Acidobacteriota bacterium]